MTNQTGTYSQKKWSLADLFPSADSPEMKAAFEQLETQVTAFEARRGELQADIDPEVFLEMITQMEQITRVSYRVYNFASLRFTEDTQDENSQAFVGKVQQFFAGLQNRTLFFSLWWKMLDDESASRLMQYAGPYTYWLQEMRNARPYTLTEPEEKVINLKDVTGSGALNTLYDMLTNRYVFKVEVDGEIREMTRGQLMALAYSPNPEHRANAYQELYRVYGNDATILGTIYQSLVRDWYNENITLRKYSTPIAVRNLANDVPDQAVETLLEVARNNAVVFQRYFKLKAKWLGMEKLRRYDIYAPVVQSEKIYPYDEATQMVFEAFSEFHPEFTTLADKVFASDHVDSEVRRGKQDGAFCASVGPDLVPWVLLNYQGRAHDVATMAHELGHAIHSQLARNHPVFTFHASLPLAETASTFAEMLLVDKLLKSEEDEMVRVGILFRQVSDAYATIMRQAWFAIFEKEAHSMIQQDASVGELSARYLELLKEQFGDAVAVSDEFKHEWVSIPHIFGVPFYVYAYAFGQLLVFALYQQYKAEGQAFIPRLFKILSAGGSASAEEILTQAGIDIRSPDFWQGGFDVIADLVTQLEKIPVKK